MPIDIMMPALSPTMEEGTLAKWLVKAGDVVKPGDILAEIETDKATMEFEAADGGVIQSITVSEGTDGVKVGAIIATLLGEDEAGDAAQAAQLDLATSAPEAQDDAPVDPVRPSAEPRPAEPMPAQAGTHGASPAAVVLEQPQGATPPASSDARIKASPLARRIAAQTGMKLLTLAGSGPNGRIVRTDVQGALPQRPGTFARTDQVARLDAAAAPGTTPRPVVIPDVPHDMVKLTNMRKTIARRLTEAKQTVPHIYLTVDVHLDALLLLRAELNASLEARGVKLSVNDLLVKALGLALMSVPECNVMFTPDQLVTFKRVDVSVAVSTPTGLITPVLKGADIKSLSAIATEVKELAARARDGRLKPEEYQGGTASISNMGMFGIKQFDAVINPPQGMIMAVGAGEKRPMVMADGTLGVGTIMSVTGSFDHRAIDGADGARLMQAFRSLVETPLTLLA